MAQPILRFMACSDLHFKDKPDCVEKQRFEKGLRLLYEYAGSQPYSKVDAIYIVGDFADQGEMGQMLSVKDSVDRCVQPETLVNLCMGSHEYFGKGGEVGGRKRFTRIFGQPDNTHLVINGFHFISVTSTRGCRFAEKQIKFAQKALAEAHAQNPFKPIFFFQHPHVSDTVTGSIDWGEKFLNPVLVNYPQIIDFSGHSHAPVNDPRSIHQQHFTSVGTGTFSYFELDEFDKIYGTHPPKQEQAAQMIIVEAFADGSVKIMPYDVLTEQFFDIAWTVETPWEPNSFVYTREKRIREATAPYFAEGSSVQGKKQGKMLTLTFDQAKHQTERVNDYIITLRDENGAVAKRFTVWSEYYFANMPEQMTYSVPAPPAGKYTVTVQARGFWYNLSENVLTAKITL